MLKISVIQKSITSLSQQNERDYILENTIARAASDGSQAVVFPELCNAVASTVMMRQSAEEKEKVIAKFCQWSQRYHIWIFAGVLYRADPSHLCNALIVCNDKGRCVGEYQKSHLIEQVAENQMFYTGQSLSLLSTPWGKIGLAICYDIHFPNMFRQYALAGADAIVIPSMIRYHRVEQWNLLVKARAYENHIFMIACNYIGYNDDFPGEDPIGHAFHRLGGLSCIIDPEGKPVIQAGQTHACMLSVSLDLSESLQAKQQYPSLKTPDLDLPVLFPKNEP